MPKPSPRGTNVLGIIVLLGLFVVVGYVVMLLGQSYTNTTGTSGALIQVATPQAFDPYPISGPVVVPTVNAPPSEEEVLLPTPIPITNPTPQPLPPADAPFNLVIQALPGEWDPEDMTKKAPVVLTGTVTKVFPAQWTTPDGLRPKNPWSKDNVDTIYTPVEVTVSELIKGKKYAKRVVDTKLVTLMVLGGVVGKDSVTFTPYDFREGEQVLLFLKDERKSLKFKEDELYEIHAYYKITNDGSLVNFFQAFPGEETFASVRNAATP